MTGDEFLDELLSNDASLDDGAVPDIKAMDSGINLAAGEVRKQTKKKAKQVNELAKVATKPLIVLP